MNMKGNCIVLFAQPYNVVNDKTGEVNEGVTIHYLGSENLEPISDERSKGHKVIKCALPVACVPKITKVPGLYGISFKMSSDKDLKGQLKVLDLEFINELMVENV